MFKILDIWGRGTLLLESKKKRQVSHMSAFWQTLKTDSRSVSHMSAPCPSPGKSCEWSCLHGGGLCCPGWPLVSELEPQAQSVKLLRLLDRMLHGRILCTEGALQTFKAPFRYSEESWLLYSSKQPPKRRAYSKAGENQCLAITRPWIVPVSTCQTAKLHN